MTIFLISAAGAQAKEVVYTGGSYRDPFVGQVQEKVADDTFKIEQKIRALAVQGVLLSAKNPRAIIGNKIYNVGSSLESGKITRIDKDGVAVTVNGKEIIIEQKIRKAKYEAPQPKV